MEDYINLSKKEAKKIGKQLYNDWHITSKEKIAFLIYRISSKRINSYARKDIDNNFVEIISNALKKSFINHEIVVKRETNKLFLESNRKDFNNVKINDVLIEKGFTSTFLYKPKWVCKGKVRLKIKVPKGINGAYINPLFLGFRFENELLLDKNMSYIVEGKRYDAKCLYLDLLCLETS